MHVCVYIYIYNTEIIGIYTHMYVSKTHTHTLNLWTCIYIYIYTYVCMCIYNNFSVCVCVCVFFYVCVLMCICGQAHGNSYHQFTLVLNMGFLECILWSIWAPNLQQGGTPSTTFFVNHCYAAMTSILSFLVSSFFLITF